MGYKHYLGNQDEDTLKCAKWAAALEDCKRIIESQEDILSMCILGDCALGFH